MRISNKKKEKISEQVLALLYSKNPKSLFTSEIAQELARDEEFIKKILLNLNNKKLVVKISKNQKGIDYIRRLRWRMSKEAYKAYKTYQLKI